MKLDIVLKQKQSQNLSLTQEMKQSLNILGMDSIELREYITEVAMENPAIELEQISLNDEESLRERKREWLKNNTIIDEVPFFSKTNDYDKNYEFEKMASETTELTLVEHIIKQIDLTPNIKNKNLLKYLANYIDDDGYLRIKSEDFKGYNGKFTKTIIAEAISTLQSFEPNGVGARNLEECLILQLNENQVLEKLIINNYLELAVKKQFKKISFQIKYSIDEIQKAYQNIQSLNPRPGNGFYVKELVSYSEPDIIVANFKNHLTILPCEFGYPTINLNKEISQVYLSTEKEETKKYLKEKIDEIEWLQKSIKNRTNTLVKVAKAIVSHQEDFFRYDSKSLKILRMIDIAEELDIHESTVSRAVKGKYIQCYHGIYPMKYFFVQGTKNGEIEGNDVSSQAIKVKLKELIKNEDKKKPYSDNDLANLLTDQGFKISRRTVLKYREEMSILKSSFRKE